MSGSFRLYIIGIGMTSLLTACAGGGSSQGGSSEGGSSEAVYTPPPPPPLPPLREAPALPAHTTAASYRAIQPRGGARLVRPLGRYAWQHVTPGADGSPQATAVTATADGRVAASAGEDGRIRVWDLQADLELIAFAGGHAVYIDVLALSPEGRRGASGDRDGRIRVWDVSSGTVVRELRGKGGVRALTFSPDGAQLMSLGGDGDLQAWDLATATTTREWKAPSSALHFSPHSMLADFESGGRAIVNAADYVGSRVVDLSTGKDVVALPQNFRVALGGDLAVCAESSGPVEAWSLTGEKVATMPELPANASVHVVAASTDGRVLVAWEADRQPRVTLWVPRSGAVKHMVMGGQTTALTFVGQRALRATSSGQVVVLDLQSPTGGSGGVVGHTWGKVSALAVTADGSRAVSIAYDGRVCVWDLAEGKLAMVLLDPPAESRGWLAISPDGARAASLNVHGHLRLWDVKPDASSKWANLPETGRSLAYSPDGTRLVVGTREQVLVLDAATGARIEALPLIEHSGGVEALAVTTDLSRALSSENGPDGSLTWEPRDGGKVRFRFPQGDCVRAATISADGKRGLTASRVLGVVRGWDLESGKPLRVFESAAQHVGSIALTPDGRRAAWCVGASAFVADLEGKAEPAGLDLSQAEDPPTAVALTPDGRTLLVGTSRGVVLQVAVD